MATEQNPSGRRPHYHRGRRGTDRRGSERRSQQPVEPSPRPSGEADVEQIMREIRSRIAQRHGIELSTQQIQDLAARRLEAVLDPRTANPTLFDQLRKSAATPSDPSSAGTQTEHALSDDAIYEGGAVVRFFRRLFNPLMKLLFNPSPLIAAIQAQTRINREAATRAADLERRQTEWNALHYQILQRLVTEVSRASIEVQALGTRLESLAARVDFNDKRIRTLENTPAVTRTPRPQESVSVAAATTTDPTAPPDGAPAVSATATGDSPRRRRRRRRGRRGASPTADSAMGAESASALPEATTDVDEGDDEDDVVDATEAIEPARAEQLSPEPRPEVAVATSTPSWSPRPEPEIQPTVEQQSSEPDAVQQGPTSTPGRSHDSGAPEN